MDWCGGSKGRTLIWWSPTHRYFKFFALMCGPTANTVAESQRQSELVLPFYTRRLRLLPGQEMAEERVH